MSRRQRILEDLADWSHGQTGVWCPARFLYRWAHPSAAHKVADDLQALVDAGLVEAELDDTATSREYRLTRSGWCALAVGPSEVLEGV